MDYVNTKKGIKAGENIIQDFSEENKTKCLEYEKYLAFLFDEIGVEENMDSEKWLIQYQLIEDDVENNLPKALALISKKFWKGMDFDNNEEYMFRSSTQAEEWRNTCKCVWWGEEQNCNYTVKIQADHVWPKSLGGLSISDNCEPLCEIHNLMKGNSIFFFNWKFKHWMKQLLQTLQAHHHGFL